MALESEPNARTILIKQLPIGMGDETEKCRLKLPVFWSLHNCNTSLLNLHHALKNDR